MVGMSQSPKLSPLSIENQNVMVTRSRKTIEPVNDKAIRAAIRRLRDVMFRRNGTRANAPRPAKTAIATSPESD